MKSTLTYPVLNNQAYWPVNFERVSKSVQRSLSLGQKVLRFFSSLMVTSPSISIWKHVDSTGRETWSAYDRDFDRSTSRLSETEMRAWIEARYQA